jgi:purine-nucleoside/S-methyl-5'-thioadenosine phosphorylase / adenosine deaminase
MSVISNTFFYNFHMQVTIQSIKIKSLSAQRSLIHAFSPRSFELEDGGEGALDFGTLKTDPALSMHGQWFLRSIGIENDDVYRVRQVHGDRVYDLNDPLNSIEKVADIAADAIVTRRVNTPIAVLTADCVPVVIYDPRLHVAGVVHAGRKGTSQNIVSKTAQTLQEVYGCKPEELLLGMGPGIGGCCYEVDAPSIEPFKKHYSGWTQFVKKTPTGKFMLDLFAANREDAQKAGLDPKNISQTGLCTSCEVERFFSYRREGTAGRMMTVAMLSST